MNFKVIEFGVLSHRVRPLSLLTPLATNLQKWSHSTFVLSANGSCYQPMMVGTCGPPQLYQLLP